MWVATTNMLELKYVRKKNRNALKTIQTNSQNEKKYETKTK